MTRSPHLRASLGLGLAVGLAATLAPGRAAAVTRSEVMARAKAYVYHPWTSTTANASASCVPAGYKTLYTPGDYMGLPYDWGGYMSLFEFDQQIAQGYAAGSYENHGVLSCTSGVDCSGFVSQAWGSGHFATATIHQGSAQITQGSMLAGDIFNQAGYHVALFSHLLANGTPLLYEAIGPNVHINSYGGFSYLSGYVPRRYNKITGTSAADDQGTTTKPIVVTSFPFTDARDTRTSISDVFDGCGAAPSKDESGPEFVYKVTFTQPGTLTATVSDDATADIDVHISSSLNTSDCVARADATVSQAVDCGTYYVIADSYAGMAGNFNLTLSFAPSGAACGAGPKVYKATGAFGDACAYPGNPNLGFCNGTLGADTCIYGQSDSFCSHPCATAADCTEAPGACCVDISGKGERYCLKSSFCGGGTVTSQPKDGGMSGDPDPTDPGPGAADGGADPGTDPDLPTDVPPEMKAGGCTVSPGSARSSWPLLLAPLAWWMVRRRRSLRA